MAGAREGKKENRKVTKTDNENMGSGEERGIQQGKKRKRGHGNEVGKE